MGVEEADGSEGWALVTGRSGGIWPDDAEGVAAGEEVAAGSLERERCRVGSGLSGDGLGGAAGGVLLSGAGVEGRRIGARWWG